MLWGFLNGAYDYDALYKKFYFHYVDGLQDDSLSDADWDAFGAIHEKMDFVAEDPDMASADGLAGSRARNTGNGSEYFLRGILFMTTLSPNGSAAPKMNRCTCRLRT